MTPEDLREEWATPPTIPWWVREIEPDADGWRRFEVIRWRRAVARFLWRARHPRHWWTFGRWAERAAREGERGTS